MSKLDSQAKGTESRDIRTSLIPKGLARAFLDHLYYAQGRIPAIATRNDLYMALAYTVRDKLLARWVAEMKRLGEYRNKIDLKVVCYFSAEFLLGPHLGNNLLNLGITEEIREAMTELGLDFESILAQEEEPGLGNGGLGGSPRASWIRWPRMEIPSLGYGIRYEFGIFKQEIRDGWQVEMTDKWLQLRQPLGDVAPGTVSGGEVRRAYRAQPGGGRPVAAIRWIPARVVKGIPYDTPILGYVGTICEHPSAVEGRSRGFIRFQGFQRRGLLRLRSMKRCVRRTMTKVLYPNDEPEMERGFGWTSSIFFVSCSLQDMLRIGIMLGIFLQSDFDENVRGATERHPSGHCHGRIDAAAGGRR